MDLEKYRRLFVDEATDHLVEMSRALALLGEDTAAEARADAIDTLFCMAHSIKGMAASLDYDAVSTLAHRLEDWLEPLRSGSALSEHGLPLLFESVRALEEMVGIVDESGHCLTFFSQRAILSGTPERRGWREASTFPGFCDRHDRATFAPIETVPFIGSAEQSFLLAYRAECHELYQKQASHRSQESTIPLTRHGTLQETRRKIGATRKPPRLSSTALPGTATLASGAKRWFRGRPSIPPSPLTRLRRM